MEEEDQAPSSAAESLRLITEQTAATQRSLTLDARLQYWPWGFSWLIGFGLLYLRNGPDGQVLWNLPSWLPLATLFALMIVALVVTSVAGARAGRHLVGNSPRRGKVYGLAWGVGFLSVFTVAGRLSRYLPGPEVGLMWGALSIGVVATLYLAGSAIWGGQRLMRLGLWTAGVNILGVWAGPGWHSLIISLAGGGGLILAGLIANIHRGQS